MFKKVMVLLLMVFSLSTIYACKNPDNVFCVMFKFDYSFPVDLSLFEVIGDAGVNYLNDSASGKDITMSSFNDVYSYRSHYNDYVLVEVASGGINFIIDTAGVNSDSFNADSCVNKEFEWLNLVGIVQISRVDREAIATAFTEGFESKIYWTKWDTSLGSDMVADSSGTFSKVRCSSEFTIKFPPKPLEYATGIINNNRITPEKARITKPMLVDIRGRKIQSSGNFMINKFSPNVIIRYDLSTGVANRQIKLH